MQFKLVHQNNSSLANSWQTHFTNQPNVEIINNDICQENCDAIVSPANSFGFMDGGLDLALSERFGWGLETKVQKAIRNRPLKELLIGEALTIPTEDPQTLWLIVAPTMRVPMKLRQSINAYLAMKAILIAAKTHTQKPAIQVVAIPGLGTGVGGLAPEIAALQMWQAFKEVELDDYSFPTGFSATQRSHILLNPEEIKIWD